jgi:predicted DNA-binding protein (MmcQ/YjbR family)
MNIEEFREYCLSFKGVHEKMPFPNVPDKYSRDVLCFYVADKWFCFVNIEIFDFCCIKCNPDESEERHKTRMAHEQEILDQCLFQPRCT